MSNETISFPRELSDDLAEFIAEKARVCGGGAYEIWEALCERFGQPAERHQGEPVAEVYRGPVSGVSRIRWTGHKTAPVGTKLYTCPGAQLAPAAVAPEGWKLVPTVPNDDMIVAFAEAWYSKRQAIDDPDMLDAYRDMLVVAPNPPQQ